VITWIIKKEVTKMISAYIMTEMQPGHPSDALENIKSIEHVKNIAIVTGDYDIVVRAEVPELQDLFSVTNQLQKIKGLIKTTTHIIEKEISM
jgi:DNA-binding Lrp family transcriptional regulator